MTVLEDKRTLWYSDNRKLITQALKMGLSPDDSEKYCQRETG